MNLWKKKWDILFYGGHGDTSDKDQVGKIRINKEDWLKVSDIKNHLKRAIDYGLKLAIFNACDGLGLAYQLADGEDLHLPQVIVRRDWLPVPLAPLFLKGVAQLRDDGHSCRSLKPRLQASFSYVQKRASSPKCATPFKVFSGRIYSGQVFVCCGEGGAGAVTDFRG